MSPPTRRVPALTGRDPLSTDHGTATGPDRTPVGYGIAGLIATPAEVHRAATLRPTGCAEVDAAEVLDKFGPAYVAALALELAELAQEVRRVRRPEPTPAEVAANQARRRREQVAMQERSRAMPVPPTPAQLRANDARLKASR